MPGPNRRPLADRLWEKVDVRGPNECWLWTKVTMKHGYATIVSAGHNGPKILVHRAAWEITYGPIPDGMTVDHICHTLECGKSGADCFHRRCCNPQHLKLELMADNIKRTSPNFHKTHCPAGHPYDDENTGLNQRGSGVSRKCRQCDNERHKQIRANNGKTHNGEKTHCPQGHLYDEENTRIERLSGGGVGRRCKTCERARKRTRPLPRVGDCNGKTN